MDFKKRGENYALSLQKEAAALRLAAEARGDKRKALGIKPFAEVANTIDTTFSEVGASMREKTAEIIKPKEKLEKIAQGGGE